MSDAISVEVVYALPRQQQWVRLKIEAGSTAREAIEASGLLQRHPEIDLSENKVGIYGKLVGLDTALREHDRVEIYRPLLVDPKQARRQRAERSRAKKER